MNIIIDNDISTVVCPLIALFTKLHYCHGCPLNIEEKEENTPFY